ncbi:TetR/AcrR family transcriptional regulator [Streptomyces sp. G45]|uniref:TetR/AcrR family transcriptional regulator n=1 Tax=Streptomyces sp. G45 TaxID=3406627 RepID=UPI003C15AD5A
MRADAARSRRKILDAARDVFLERGADAPLDLIVRRAGIGPATLYRRYPDRQALVRDLAEDLLTRLGEVARAALAEAERSGDAFAALRSFLHEAARMRMGAVVIVLLEQLTPSASLVRVRAETAAAAEELVRAARGQGALRDGIGLGDLVLLSVRLVRPLTGPLARLDPDGVLLHRDLDLALDGLDARAAHHAPTTADHPAEGLSFADLLAAAEEPDSAAAPKR